MSYTEASLKAAFAGDDQGNPATDWYRRRGFASRDNAGLCQGVSNAALAFTLGRDPNTMENGVEWFLSATDAWDASPTTGGDIYNCEPGTQIHFAIPSVPDGHVMTKLEGRGRYMHAHQLYSGESWGLNLGVTDLDWFLAQRPWYVLRGLTRSIGPNAIVLSAPAPQLPGPAERQIAPGDPARVRLERSTGETPVVRLVDPGSIFAPLGYRPGEAVDGTDLWASTGDGWLSFATLTDRGTHDLTNLTPVDVPPVVPEPSDPEPIPGTPPPTDPSAPEPGTGTGPVPVTKPVPTGTPPWLKLLIGGIIVVVGTILALLGFGG